MTPENVGQQFITLYRGLSGVQKMSDIQTEYLGNHWTPSRSVAHSFALNAPYQVVGEPPVKFKKLRGVVLTANVHPDHIFDPEESEGELLGMGVFGRDSHEEEHTVRDGSPISITGVDKVSFKDGDHDVTSVPMKRFPKQGVA